MRTWVRAPWPMLCGACGREIAKGAPMLEITFYAQQPQQEPLPSASRPATWTQTKARCENCVLEHPAASSAWATFGLLAPPRAGGWVMADWEGGWTCCVDQGHYGHRAQKATWLYANGVELPRLTWGKSDRRVRLDEGFHSAEERR